MACPFCGCPFCLSSWRDCTVTLSATSSATTRFYSEPRSGRYLRRQHRRRPPVGARTLEVSEVDLASRWDREKAPEGPPPRFLRRARAGRSAVRC